MLRTVLSPTNCDDIRLQYITASVSSSMGGEENEISHSLTFPIGSGTQVDGLRQFEREIGVCILFVNVARGVAE